MGDNWAGVSDDERWYLIVSFILMHFFEEKNRRESIFDSLIHCYVGQSLSFFFLSKKQKKNLITIN